MPPHKNPASPYNQSSRELSSRVLDILLHLERQVVKIRKEQYLASDQNFYTENILALQKRYLELVQYLETVPGVLLEKIIESLLQMYKDRYDLIDKGELLSVFDSSSLFSVFRSKCLGSD